MKLRVLQWNVWFREDSQNIINLVKQTNADILCLQELTEDSFLNPGQNIPKQIAALGYNFTYKVTLARNGEKHTRMGNAVFSKVPILHSRHIQVQWEQQGDGPEHENRFYVEATLDVQGKPFTVGTVHMSYIQEFKTTEDKKAETERLLDAIKPNTERFILTGDLNATPDTETIHMLDAVLASAGPSYDQATWTTKPFEHNNFKANTLDWRLDYAFATEDVRVLSSTILRTDASDHLPILIEVDA